MLEEGDAGGYLALELVAVLLRVEHVAKSPPESVLTGSQDSIGWKRRCELLLEDQGYCRENGLLSYRLD